MPSPALHPRAGSRFDTALRALESLRSAPAFPPAAPVAAAPAAARDAPPPSPAAAAALSATDGPAAAATWSPDGSVWASPARLVAPAARHGVAGGRELSADARARERGCAPAHFATPSGCEADSSGSGAAARPLRTPPPLRMPATPPPSPRPPRASAAASASPPPAQRCPLRGVEMLYGDGCACAELLQATHVYAFDRVFSRQTLRALAARLGRCAFFVLVSYRQPKVRPTDRTNE
jgi:hypothetical protein